MCQEISMVMATEAYEINKSKTGHPVLYPSELFPDIELRNYILIQPVSHTSFSMAAPTKNRK